MVYDYYKMREAIKKEKTKKGIALRLGVSRPTLYRWMKKYDRDNNLIQNHHTDQGAHNDD